MGGEHRGDPAPAGLREQLAGAVADRLPVAVRGARWQLSGRPAAGLALVALPAVAVAWWLARPGTPEVVPAPTVVAVASETVASETAGATGATTPPDVAVTVVVDVAGLVVAPGVYELPLGSRVVDAIEAAGGTQPGVSTSGLNLARVLLDGEQVAVGIEPAPDAGGGAGGGDGATTGPGPPSPLDLNTATATELDALPGVGPVLASRIVEWREANGRFSTVDELLEVSGIGEATLGELAPLVRV